MLLAELLLNWNFLFTWNQSHKVYCNKIIWRTIRFGWMHRGKMVLMNERTNERIIWIMRNNNVHDVSNIHALLCARKFPEFRFDLRMQFYAAIAQKKITRMVQWTIEVVQYTNTMKTNQFLFLHCRIKKCGKYEWNLFQQNKNSISIDFLFEYFSTPLTQTKRGHFVRMTQGHTRYRYLLIITLLLDFIIF